MCVLVLFHKHYILHSTLHQNCTENVQKMNDDLMSKSMNLIISKTLITISLVELIVVKILKYMYVLVLLRAI